MPGVARCRTVVPDQEIRARGDDPVPGGRYLVASRVRLRERLPVHLRLGAGDRDPLARQADDALDKRARIDSAGLCGGRRGPVDNDVTSLETLETRSLDDDDI